MVQALIAGQVDLVGGTSTQVQNIDRVAGEGKFEQKFVVARAYNAAFRPNERALVDACSAFIAKSLADGSLAALFKKWIGAELPEMPATGEGETALPIMVAKE